MVRRSVHSFAPTGLSRRWPIGRDLRVADLSNWKRAGRLVLAALVACFLSIESAAAAKPHIISFGKWTNVQGLAGLDEKPLLLKIRPLIVDGRVKEYAVGLPHDITDRLFVVRRAFRINDSLPEEPGPVRWQWQRGGWLLVDRGTGRVSPLPLPDFDTVYSVASWFRDYVAYCGVAEDGKKVFTIVAQLGRRKPVLRSALPNASIADDAPPDSVCSGPRWQRSPVRVTFESPAGRQTYAIRAHAVDLLAEDDQEEVEVSR